MNADPGENADERAVMDCVRAFDDSFDSRDYETVASLCTDDFIFIGSGEGEESEGGTALGPTMTALLADVGPTFVSWKLEFAEPYRVTIHGDTAIVVRKGRFELVMANSQRTGWYRITGVLRHKSDGWKWCLFHGSEAQPW